SALKLDKTLIKYILLVKLITISTLLFLAFPSAFTSVKTSNLSLNLERKNDVVFKTSFLRFLYINSSTKSLAEYILSYGHLLTQSPHEIHTSSSISTPFLFGFLKSTGQTIKFIIVEILNSSNITIYNNSTLINI